jgi:hypothetical protein
MTENLIDKLNFKLWYKRVLENLYDDPDAGFPILMMTFPLLERYLREKSENYENNSLNDKYHEELLKVFPELMTVGNSKTFWKIYRHGILHQATLSKKDKTISGCLTSRYNSINIDSKGVIYINPADFSKKVIMAIESDFNTFIAASSTNHMLPVVYKLQKGDKGTAGPGPAGDPRGSTGTSETVSGGKFQYFKP